VRERQAVHWHQEAEGLPPKQCFASAQRVAVIGKRATYVEGLCVAPEMPNFPFAHAWLTLDGEHSIDVTLPDAEKYAYFGITFDNHQVSQFILTNKCWGSLLNLPDFAMPLPPQLAEAVRS
jgi:hypothetical protein